VNLKKRVLPPARLRPFEQAKWQRFSKGGHVELSQAVALSLDIDPEDPFFALIAGDASLETSSLRTASRARGKKIKRVRPESLVTFLRDTVLTPLWIDFAQRMSDAAVLLRRGHTKFMGSSQKTDHGRETWLLPFFSFARIALRMGWKLPAGFPAAQHALLRPSDWSSWIAKRPVAFWQVVALSLDIPPEILEDDGPFSLDAAKSLGLSKEFLRRYEIAEGHLGYLLPIANSPSRQPGVAPELTPISFEDFAVFAEAKGWALPSDFPRPDEETKQPRAQMAQEARDPKADAEVEACQRTASTEPTESPAVPLPTLPVAPKPAKAPKKDKPVDPRLETSSVAVIAALAKIANINIETDDGREAAVPPIQEAMDNLDMKYMDPRTIDKCLVAAVGGMERRRRK